MPPVVGHLFPDHASVSSSTGETVETLLETEAVRIERIASYGQPSPQDFWYNQANQEWVVLLQGTATLQFSDDEGAQTNVDLNAGDYLLIPAHRRHRVERTSPDALWLAVHAG